MNLKIFICNDIFNKTKFYLFLGGNFQMKKFLLSFSCTVMILIIAVGCVFGGGAEVFHVCIGNIEIITGGNDAVGGVHNADMMKIFEDKEYKKALYQSLGVSLEEAWAHYKFTSKFEDDLSFSYRGFVNIRPNGKLVSQIPANTIPKKNVLLNADAPISITSCSDEISLFYSRHLDSDTEAVRLLDDKGKVLAKLDSPYKVWRPTAEVKLSHEFKNYYLELKKYAEKKYCYIFLRMKATDRPVKQSEKLSQQDNMLKNQAEMYEQAKNEYMQQHNISDPDKLTEADEEAIVEMLKDKSMPADQRKIQKQAEQIIKDYMRKNSITDYNQLTEKDWKVLEAEMQKQLIGQNYRTSETPKKETTQKNSAKKSSSKKKRK